MLQQNTFGHEKVLRVLATKRKAERVKSTFSGAISAYGKFTCYCVITDVSDTGMQLSVPKGTSLPDTFDIRTPAIPEVLTVKRAWMTGTNMGVIVSDVATA